MVFAKCQIVGYKRSDFATSDGKKIEGYKIWCLSPMSGDDCAGKISLESYVSLARLGGGSPHLGDVVMLERVVRQGHTKYRYLGPASV